MYQQTPAPAQRWMRWLSFVSWLRLFFSVRRSTSNVSTPGKKTLCGEVHNGTKLEPSEYVTWNEGVCNDCLKAYYRQLLTVPGIPVQVRTDATIHLVA